MLCLPLAAEGARHDVAEKIPDFPALLRYCVTHSTESSVSEADVSLQKATSSTVNIQRLVPQIDVFASFQRLNYDNLFLRNGEYVNNNGNNPTAGIGLSYDLQRLFGPESSLAEESSRHSIIQSKISRRNVVRTVKKSYLLLRHIESELELLRKISSDFDRVGNILRRQKSLGVFVDVENSQFRVQKEFLASELKAKGTEKAAVYFAFSSLMNISYAEAEQVLNSISDGPNLVFAQKENLDSLSLTEDATMLAGLSHEYNLTKLEYESYQSYPLPTAFIRSFHQWTSIPSIPAGPNQLTEAGVTFPISGFVTRREHKQELQEKANKSRTVMEKNILEYKNTVRLTITQLQHYMSERSGLETLRHETDKALQKSFQYYAQKRVDTLTILDLFMKSLQAARLQQFNRLHIETLDAELEYLLGGSHA
ncbi:MAG: hypothetical protein LDLANPLL_01830 [Turneriella sp.]|nr:hypothetical protein [Turneriella sp.]